MKNKESWSPSKFSFRNGKLKSSKDPKEVNIPSRLITNLVAEFYDENIKVYVKGNLLDLGCGKVPLYESYAPYISSNVCVDWENEFHQYKHLDVISDLNNTLPLEENKYDTIILSDVLEHLSEPKLIWSEMNRVMVKDGILLLNVPFFYGLHSEPYDYCRYTRHALIKMAKESGFEIIEIKELGGVPEIFADITSKSLSRIPYLGSILGVLIQKLTWIFVKSFLGKKISRVSASKFPLAYGLIAKKL